MSSSSHFGDRAVAASHCAMGYSGSSVNLSSADRPHRHPANDADVVLGDQRERFALFDRLKPKRGHESHYLGRRLVATGPSASTSSSDLVDRSAYRRAPFHGECFVGLLGSGRDGDRRIAQESECPSLRWADGVLGLSGIGKPVVCFNDACDGERPGGFEVDVAWG